MLPPYTASLLQRVSQGRVAQIVGHLQMAVVVQKTSEEATAYHEERVDAANPPEERSAQHLRTVQHGSRDGGRRLAWDVIPNVEI